MNTYRAGLHEITALHFLEERGLSLPEGQSFNQKPRNKENIIPKRPLSRATKYLFYSTVYVLYICLPVMKNSQSINVNQTYLITKKQGSFCCIWTFCNAEVTSSAMA